MMKVKLKLFNRFDYVNYKNEKRRGKAGTQRAKCRLRKHNININWEIKPRLLSTLAGIKKYKYKETAPLNPASSSRFSLMK